ncbi:NAD-dependent epimerase/dehydratase family protein [Streptomyces niger]|uniref:NAD-dependent epimerase/dehydratase family protein n=1 Tax=Streptomyces niger TaxID=66373 RepID=UPI000B1EEBAD|nr:NAD-dependent epimerase/dehydratase family protein [Streptomyces niger]
MLITGGAGFIGGHLARHLVAEQADVVVVDDLRAEPLISPEGTGKFLEKPVLDMTEQDVEGVRLVYHLASHKSVPRSFRQPLDYLDNVDSGRHLLDLCAGVGVERVIVGSTCEVYGQAETLPTPEDAPLSPRSPYASSKVALEMLAQAHQRAGGFPEVGVVRFFNVYGPGERPDALVPRLCANLLLRNELPIEGDGQQRRDFTYISDVVRKLEMLAHGDIAPVINLGSGHSYSVSEVVGFLRDISPTAETVRKPGRVNEISEFRAGTTLQDRLLAPSHISVDMATGVHETLSWWESRDMDDTRRRVLLEETN